MHHYRSLGTAATLIAFVGALVMSHRAEACGCFSPPSPELPVFQAGEHILFSVRDDVVTAHVQIRYSGPADRFGWLLPVPSKPGIELGTDELFAHLLATTNPQFNIERVYSGHCSFDPARIAAENGRFGNAVPSGDENSDSVVVEQDSIGPFDFAILKANSKKPMMDWLLENDYFIAPETDEVVAPYLKDGFYFLALKLRKGNAAGDIQPVVLTFDSKKAMIPIILTRVAAEEDMPVRVWVLGEHRAIPENYHHTKLNMTQIDWLNGGQNYQDVVTKAVDESPENHSFVTEYAGEREILDNLLDYPNRFGDLEALAKLTDRTTFVQALLNNGFTYQTPSSANQLLFPAQLLSILQRFIPVPDDITASGVTPLNYYTNIAAFPGDPSPIDAAALTKELKDRIVEPTRSAAALIESYSYLTRLFTTLSPSEMTKDPVFSFNPDLPDVSNQRAAKLIYHCGIFGTGDQGEAKTPATLIVPGGWKIRYPKGVGAESDLKGDLPASFQTEQLSESGPPTIISSNSALISDEVPHVSQDQTDGCSVLSTPTALPAWFVMLIIGLGWIRRRV